MTRKAGLLSRHRKLIAKLLKREASHHRFYEKVYASNAEQGGMLCNGVPAGPYWQRESIARARKAELAEDALKRFEEAP